MKKLTAALSIFPAVLGVAGGLNFASRAESKGAEPTVPALTFTRNIAPIVFSHCSSCHRPGEAAPFSLLTYADVQKRAKQIVQVTEAHTMPPFKADPGDCSFRDDIRLTSDQVAAIKTWADNGAPEGPASEMPKLPAFSGGWQLGKPDLIVKMDRAYPVKADGPDVYRNFALPLNLSEDTWVRAIEFRPGARSIVHHSLLFYDATGNGRKKEGQDGMPGFGGGMGGLVGGGGGLKSLLNSNSNATSPVGSLGGWALGGNAMELPDGLAYHVPKGADLILSTHFHPSGKAENEVSTVGIYFAPKAPAHPFMAVQMPPLFGVFSGLKIPAGEKNYVIADSYKLPVDVKAFGVSAHAHYLGKDFSLIAELPNGIIKKLILIPDWDFNWQGQYLYKSDVPLPKGTTLRVKLVYDNSATNPRNPSSPPKNVKWGEQSTDEMGSITLRLTAQNDTDMPALEEDYKMHVRDCIVSEIKKGGLSDLRKSRQK